jgi:azurin
VNILRIPHRRWFLLCACSAPLAFVACGPEPPPAPLVDLLVETDGDLLAFKPKELTCHEGDRVRLTFRHTGKYVNFEHNWALILPHTFEGVTAAAEAAGPENGWMPKNDRRILAATPLCGRGSVVMIEFVAPAAGNYPFICTVPGHGQSMWGVLHVLPRSQT